MSTVSVKTSSCFVDGAGIARHKSMGHVGYEGFFKTCFHNSHSIPCFMRQPKQLLNVQEMANKKLHKLHYYLQQFLIVV